MLDVTTGVPGQLREAVKIHQNAQLLEPRDGMLALSSRELQHGRDVFLPFCGLDMNTINRITMNPGVCGGRPCIRGLRIRVKDVLDLFAAGATREEVLADYPDLEPHGMDFDPR